MDVSVDSDVLQTLHTKEATSLHRISDDLSACGVGKIVDLPQIIVVGEQSAGKSSVLEAISHIRFPVDSSVCTRFATELIFHHASETRIEASVSFADKKPSQTFQRQKFHEDDLPDIIKEAKEHMGFSQDGKDFSKDVLRLEIEGPKIYPLSLVDLPGLYHTTSQNQSSVGRDTVDELVEGYMRQKNSIILVVVSANVNLVSHSALEKAKTIDPQRRRTIGVITKPDLALPSNAKEYIMVAKNQESAHKLQLGWHVLRNRGEDETRLETRDKLEASFFEKGAWATVPGEDLGIANFRKKLSGILFQHIRNSLPGVIEDIETKLRDRQEELTRLGTGRSDAKARRSYLLTIASDFQRLARDGCNGRYNDSFFGGLEDEDLKFRALLRNFNRVFDYILRTKGSTQSIMFSEDDKPDEDRLPGYLASFLDRYPYEFPDPERVTTEELSVELESKAAINQGREFPGSPNADLAMQLFKNQAAPWKRITEFHVEMVVSVAKAFVDQLFKYVIGSPQNNPTTEAILSTHVDPFFEEKEKLLRSKIDELLRPYLQGYSSPVDIEFYQALSQKSANRVANQVCKTLEDQCPELFSETSKNSLTPEKITQAMVSGQNSRVGEFGTDKIIDMMLTYYEMSRRTFTDNVVNLAIESCLVCSIPEILTPTKVDGMSDTELEDLAAERIETTSRRHLLDTEIKILQDGLTTCRKHKPRIANVLPSSRPVVSPSGPPTASKPTTKPAPAPIPAAPGPASSVPATAATAKAQPAPILSPGSSIVSPKGGMTGQVPASTSNSSATGGGGLFNSSTTPTSKPKQDATDPVQTKTPSIFDNRNGSSAPVSSGSTGGLFSSNAATVALTQKSLFGTGSGGVGGPPNQKPAVAGFGSGGSSNATKG
ncbi:hypothetical protein FIE12Z_427 [Fusarium flagelliforme]|uniref:Dynamin family protein n=1 Tax=Fusarium flagelliforme TaxID=2675880 RepID=A0A395N4Y1_9HYPO|nr:hypothetical protein FIE12Z_427 [Fusarium flagelliforme]